MAYRRNRYRSQYVRPQATRNAEPGSTGPQCVLEFDSFQAYVDAAEHSAVNPRFNASREEDGHRNEWTGGSWAEVIGLAHSGWADGRERVQALAASLYNVVGTRVFRPTIRPSVCGHAVNVGRYLAGDPECFYRWQRSEVVTNGHGRQIVRIVANITVSSGISTETIFLRGAAVVALADLLELAGVRTEIVAVDSRAGRISDGYFETRTVLKRPEDPLQPDQLAFALCHPGSFRRLGFAQAEASPVMAALGHSHGQIVETRGDRGDCYLGSAKYGEYQWNSESAVVEWIRQRLVSFGVQFEGE